MASKTRAGMRAITMQQPFAAAMAHGVGLFTRRGKPAKWAAGGEWVAVHCGGNGEHLKNTKLMAEVREEWPECPADDELRAQQKHLLGVAHFVDGDCDARAAERQCFFLRRYDCTKKSAWRADASRPCTHPVAYPRGALQVWHLYEEGFADAAEAEQVLDLAGGARAGAALPKAEEPEAGAAVKKEKRAVAGAVDSAAASKPKRAKKEKA